MKWIWCTKLQFTIYLCVYGYYQVSNEELVKLSNASIIEKKIHMIA